VTVTGGPDPENPARAAPRTDLAVQIGLVARGETAAFDAVFEQAGPAVFGIVLRVIRDPAQSEEVTQEVLLEVWRNASAFDAGRGSAMAWVMTLAHRRAVDRVRSVQKESERERRTASSDIPYDDVIEAVESSLERSPNCSASRSPWPTTGVTPTIRWPACSACRPERSRPGCGTR